MIHCPKMEGSVMRFLFFLLFISLGLLHAAGYSCNEAEWVANITDATTDQRASYSENSKGKDWYSRYFRFTTAVDGKIFIDVDKLSTRQKVSIGTTCNGTQLHDGGVDSTNYSGTFNITAGTTYYISIGERNLPNRIKFNIAFNFQASNVVDLDLSEYQPPAPNPANVGDDVSFYVQVKNQGSIAADADIIMTATYNQDIDISALVTPTYFKCTPSSGSLTAGNPISCSSTTDLNPNYTGDFTFSVKAAGGGLLKQHVLISSSSSEPTLSNNELNSSVLYNLSSYCNEHSGSKLLLDGSPGFTRIVPSGDVEKTYEVFCTNTTPSETLIALPNKNIFNNFVFKSTSVGTDYYTEATNNSRSFNAIKVSVNKDNTLVVDTAASSSGIGVMGEYFSNINLIGTPFAIDWANTTISGCDESKLRKGYHGQVVKINTLDYSNAQCKIEHMQLKLLDDYTYLQYLGKEVLEPTCKLMAESVPTNFLDSTKVKGHYWINATGGQRGGTSFSNSGRPFVAYCWYQTDLDWVWTFLLAMDGKRTIEKDDLIEGRDSCSAFGLWPFVPNKEKTFERVRRFLAQEKPEWENYTGTIQEKVNALYGNSYYLPTEQPEPIWPYGSFGVYYPKNGNNPQTWGNGNEKVEGWMSGSPMHNEKTITQDYAPMNDGANRNYYSQGHYSNTASASGGSYSYEDTMGSKGWVSILGPNDLNKTESWFISRTGAGRNFNSTVKYPYYEPNGNYTAGHWLNFLFDSIGRVRHNDDWDGNYPYYDYMCMAEDNYDFTERYALIEGPFKAIERSTPTYNFQPISTVDTNITTKIVNGGLLLDVILLDDNLTKIDNTQSRNAGMYLMGTQIVDKVEQAFILTYLGQISDFSSFVRPLNTYEDDGRFSLEPANWPNNQETWGSASKRLFVEFRYCANNTHNWKDCWYDTNATCKLSCVPGSLGCDCQMSDSNDFAVRPNNFNFSTSSGLSANTLLVQAQRPYNLTFEALDLNATPAPSLNYNEIQDTSFTLDIIRRDPTRNCIFNEFVIDPAIRFQNGQDSRTGYQFNRVGEYNVTIQEIQGSEFALVDALDTADAQRYITPFQSFVKIIPDHFQLIATLDSASKQIGEGNFTYLSKTPHRMGAELNITVQAEDFNNNITPNYHEDCYADPVEINITHSVPVDNLITNILVSDNNTSTPTNESAVPNSPFIKTAAIDFNVTDTNFTVANAGTAILSYNINFDRNVSQPINPFQFTINRLTVTDISGVTGWLDLNQTLNYVYGRLHAPRYRINGNAGNVMVYPEIYWNQATAPNALNNVIPPATQMLSVDSVNWYRNTVQVANDGNTTRMLQHRALGRVGQTVPTVNPLPDGRSSHPLLYDGSQGYPYKTIMDINTTDAPWLTYDRYDSNATFNQFDIEFNSQGNKQSNMLEDTAEVNSNRRIMW